MSLKSVTAKNEEAEQRTPGQFIDGIIDRFKDAYDTIAANWVLDPVFQSITNRLKDAHDSIKGFLRSDPVSSEMSFKNDKTTLQHEINLPELQDYQTGKMFLDKFEDSNIQIPYPANDMERQGALALGDVRTTEAELQELRREVDSIVDDAWQEYHDIPDANGRYEQLGLLPEQQYALEEARLWEALQADLSAVSPKSLGTRETEAFLATAGRMVSDEFGRQVEADDAKLDLAEAEWYDQNPAEIEGRAWDEIYQQAEIDNTIFDRAKLDFEDQSRADAEPDYEAMCYEQWRNAKPDPAIDYAEAYADVAGDATLSWRLENEDPRDILNDINGEAARDTGVFGQNENWPVTQINSEELARQVPDARDDSLAQIKGDLLTLRAEIADTYNKIDMIDNPLQRPEVYNEIAKLNDVITQLDSSSFGGFIDLSVDFHLSGDANEALAQRMPEIERHSRFIQSIEPLIERIEAIGYHVEKEARAFDKDGYQVALPEQSRDEFERDVD